MSLLRIALAGEGGQGVQSVAEILAEAGYKENQQTIYIPVRSPLLGKSLLVSFPPVTKMFQFTGSRSSCPIYSGKGDRGSPLPGSPIRISTDRCSLTAPRGVSPLAASFFAS
jgi:hypothetical protein